MKGKFLDILMVIAIIAIGFLFFELVSGNQELKKEVKTQQLQANSLIDEVGQAKEENLLLYKKLEDTQKQVSKFDGLFDSVDSQTPIESFGNLGQADLQEGKDEAVKVPRQVAQKPTTKNFLVVGHNAKLADSMMIFAVDELKNKITLISLPRDFYINGRKLNEYLARFGAVTLKEKVEEISGLAIQNYFIVDFSAFEMIIDVFGGVDIYVEKSIYDELYPNGIGEYETYSIEAGAHHLSGAEALKYARSRHSTSDFDRASRQQQIIAALKERLINYDLIGNLKTIKALFDALNKSIEMDLDFLEAINYFGKYQDFEIVKGGVISTGNLLYSSANISGQYILLPNGGNYVQIQEFIRNLIL